MRAYPWVLLGGLWGPRPLPVRGLPGGAAEAASIHEHSLVPCEVLFGLQEDFGSCRELGSCKFLWKDACVQGCSGCASSSSDEEVLEGFARELSF